jgi:hypothetical protein
MLMPVLMFLKSAWFSGPEKGRFGVAEFSTQSVSAGSRTAASGLSAGSVGVLRCVALLRAACCECMLSTQVGSTVCGA